MHEYGRTPATHVYELSVGRNGASYSFATIVEIHSAAYLKAADLPGLYGHSAHCSPTPAELKPLLDEARLIYRNMK